MAIADPPRFALDRLQAERLLYEGLSSSRFTQDTPVLPDVWLAYAAQPAEKRSLLITPAQDRGSEFTQPGELSLVIASRLKYYREHSILAVPRRESLPGDVIYNRTTVNVSLYLDEVVCVLIPLSTWWQQRIAGKPDDWPLWKVNDANPGVRRKNRAFIAEALKLADRHVRKTSSERRMVPTRARAAIAFGEPDQEAQGITAAARPLTSAEAAERYRQNFETISSGRHPSSDGAASTDTDWVARLAAEPDVLWMLRMVGTLACLLLQRHGIARSPGLADLRTGDSEQVTALLSTYYRRITHAACDLLAGIELLDSKEATAALELTHPTSPLGSPGESPRIYSVSRCRTVTNSISRSRATVKGDAATQLFGINCRDIAWAVVDSGIDATHPAFLSRETGQSRVVATFDFTFFQELLREGQRDGSSSTARSKVLQEILATTDRQALRTALQNGRELDWPELAKFIRVPHTATSYRAPLQEHGTHVAGIIGADCPETPTNAPEEYRGLCPEIRLYDFRVLGDDGQGDEFNVMAALQFIRYLNAHRDLPVIHGVNLSLSIAHDVANYACGRTPVCSECERLVSSGVVVVAAAGNDGYLEYITGKGPRDNYRSISITDPGNAEAVITVGATHRFQPHSYGVSYFSSRGPTGDGRAKPDLVAPGEKIVSAVPGTAYKAMDGTSMAAPHVSGAAALLLARHRELLGQPERIKQILCETATDLGRERYFQGAGMVDVLRALQSV